MKNSSLQVPEDLVVEILSRVLVASLARLRSTSKRWNNLIKDVILPKKSLTIMLIDSRVCLVSTVGSTKDEDKVVKITSQFRLKEDEEEVGIRYVLHHCDGLLLCITKDNRLVVWNPCSGEINWIQQRPFEKETTVYYALGKSSLTNNNEYKILRVNQYRRSGYLNRLVEYSVYDFTSNLWRSVGETRDWSIQEKMYNRHYSSTVNGNSYWLGYSYSTQDSPAPRKNILLCFDFSTERFGVLSFPDDHISSGCLRTLSVNHHGDHQQLCVLAIQFFKIDVWLATERSTGSATTISWRNLVSVKVGAITNSLKSCDLMNFLINREEENVLEFRCTKGLSKVFFSHDDVLGENIQSIKVDHYNAGGSQCSHLLGYVLPPNFSRIK